MYIIISFILLFVFLFIFFNFRQEYFDIPEFKDSFFIIPEDKGGTKIINLDKKSLHLNDKIDNKTIINEPSLKYSIQFFASHDYNLVQNKFIFYQKKYLLNQEDFYILFFDHELGIDYFLLYKSFISRDIALNYCLKYLIFLKKCIIVNAQKLN